MASTYVNDLRLEEIGSGEQSGTWGDTTNTNLELIAEGLSYGTEAITTNADTHTSTVADGATDPARSLYIEYTGTLDSACTITIAPNTLSRVHFIENGTSGSQNIIISQGSGANVTIPPGDTKAVYLDGAGSGAAVVDAFASLSVVDLKVQDDLTVTDDVAIGGLATVGGTLAVTGVVTANAGVVVDEMTLDADTLTATDTFTIDAVDDITLNSDNSGRILFGDASIIYGIASNSSSDFVLEVGTSDKAILFKGQDGGASITALTLDMSDAGSAIFNNAIYLNADLIHTGDTDTQFQFSNANEMRLIAGNVETFKTTATEVSVNDQSADVDFRVESNGNANAIFVDGGNDHVCIGTSTDFGGILNVKTTDNTANLALGCTDADANRGPVIDLRRDNSSAANGDQIGCIIFNADDDANNMTEYAAITGFIQDASNTTEDGGLIFDTATGGNPAIEKLRLSGTEAVFNEGSANDLDFRVESSGQTHAFFVDGSTNTVNFGASTNVNGADIEFTLGSGSGETPYVSLRNTGTSLTTDASARFDIGAWSNSGSNYNASGSFTGKILFMAQGNDHAYASGSFESYLVTAGNTARANTTSRLLFGCKDATSTSAVEYFRLSGDTQEMVINETSVDKDFRVESDGNANCLFVDAGSNVVCVGTTDVSVAGNTGSASGMNFSSGGVLEAAAYQKVVAYFNRMNNDGTVVEIRQNGTAEGTISVSGSTVSYNGFAGRHESSGIATSTARGTVVSTIDELDTYPADSTKAGQTRADHAKVKVSDSVGDARVYGVVDDFDENDKLFVVSVGIASVKVTGSCSGGDLLESNGDGTAKVQSDDIVRSKTIGKVTIGNSNTGVKLVSCVMYCG